MIRADTITSALISAVLAAVIAIGGYLVALGNRVTALENQVVKDTQILALVDKLDKRLTVQETLLRQLVDQEKREAARNR